MQRCQSHRGVHVRPVEVGGGRVSSALVQVLGLVRGGIVGNRKPGRPNRLVQPDQANVGKPAPRCRLDRTPVDQSPHVLAASAHPTGGPRLAHGDSVLGVLEQALVCVAHRPFDDRRGGRHGPRQCQQPHFLLPYGTIQSGFGFRYRVAPKTHALKRLCQVRCTAERTLAQHADIFQEIVGDGPALVETTAHLEHQDAVTL